MTLALDERAGVNVAGAVPRRRAAANGPTRAATRPSYAFDDRNEL